MFPEHWNLVKVIRHAFCEILTNQHKILEQQETIVAKVDEVKAKIAKLKADVEAFIAANSGGASDADLTQIGTDLDAIDALVVPAPPPAV